MSGFKLASMLKKDKKCAHIPIIFITAKDTENDLMTGFNLGADDYISKPFSLREVIARVRAVLRRTKPDAVVTEQPAEPLSFKTLTLDSNKKKAMVDNVDVALTKKEFEILQLLLTHKGRVYSREEILDKLWREDAYVLDRTVDVNITRLRRKLGDYGKYIATRLGYGYCFETE
jgi:DNA-binding response OmpR family regulator